MKQNIFNNIEIEKLKNEIIKRMIFKIKKFLLRLQACQVKRS